MAHFRGTSRVRYGIGWMPLVVLLLLIGGLAIAGYLVFRPRQVPTVAVERGTVIKAFYATGVVRPDFEYLVKSKAQGSLLDLVKREGDRIREGEVLARVDDRQLRYEVEKNKAELKEAQAQAGEDAPQRKELLAKLAEARSQLEISERTLKRTLELFEKGSASTTDVDTARRPQVQWANMVAALESQLGTWKVESQRRVEVAEANLRKAMANLADTEVHAPVTGVILERYVESQQMVGINEKLLLIAGENDKLMKAAVDEEDVRKCFRGQKVFMQLYAYGDAGPDGQPRIVTGAVRDVLPAANPTNKTYEVKIEFEQIPPGLRVGMTAELNFEEARRDNQLVVPASAVLDGKVYRPAGGRYEAVPVKVGVRTLENVEIVEGLREGDRIVRDAKQVAPVKLPPPKAPVVPTRTGDRDVAEGK